MSLKYNISQSVFASLSKIIRLKLVLLLIQLGFDRVHMSNLFRLLYTKMPVENHLWKIFSLVEIAQRMKSNLNF